MSVITIMPPPPSRACAAITGSISEGSFTGVATISTAGGQDTKITLGPRAPLFVSIHPGQVPVGTATPSALINRGSSFNVTYQRRYVQGGLLLGPRVRGPTYLKH